MQVESERFKAERVVGHGAMGTVFWARDLATGEPVALKVLRSGKREARFEREVEILARLDHPHIVRYLGHGRTLQGEPFLAMEWVDGETLRALLARRGLSLAETLRVGLGVAGGLAAAHGAGVIHRDVKPSNLILAGGDVAAVKLADFGISRLAADADRLTRTGDLLGTPLYMAPEQASHASRVGPAADVFALGCVLHECLVGQPPVLAVRGAGAGAGGSFAPVSVAVARPDAPAPVAQVLDRMLAPAPADRPADGAAALAALRGLAALELPHLAPPRRLVTPGGTVLSSSGGAGSSSFSSLGLATGSPGSSAVSQRICEILGRHAPMPQALLRSQCQRLRKDPDDLVEDDLAALAPALADAVARFTAPGSRAAVLAELLAITGQAP